MKVKHIFISFFLLFTICSFGQVYQTQTITNAGATISFNTSYRTPTLVLRPSGGAVTLLANVAINFTGTPTDGQQILVMWLAGFTLNGNTFTINGVSLTDLQALNEGQIAFKYLDGAAPVWTNTYSPDLRTAGTLSATVLEDATITVAKFPALTRGYVWVGDATGRPAAYDANGNAQLLIGDGTDLASVAVTGDIAITSGGVTSISAGAIVNADVNASAAIAYSKLATLSSGNILVGSAGNVATSVAMSGDATIVASGALTIANNAITNAKIGDDAVTLTNLGSTGQLDNFTTSTATPNSTALTTLASAAVPTGAMDVDGDVLEIHAYGTTGATANNKTISLVLGATTLSANTTTAAPNALNWTIEARIFRTGAAAQKGYCRISFNGVAQEIDVFTATEVWLANTIYVKGQNGTAAVGEITLEGFEAVTNKKNNN